MSLRRLAEKDLGLITEDRTTGFGWPVTLTDPDGNTATVSGLTDDIAQAIDPDTGALVSSRLASVAIRVQTLKDAGLDVPRSVSRRDKTPWTVEFNDINDNPHTFKVRVADQDRTLGLVVCTLESFTK